MIGIYGCSKLQHFSYRLIPYLSYNIINSYTAFICRPSWINIYNINSFSQAVGLLVIMGDILIIAHYTDIGSYELTLLQKVLNNRLSCIYGNGKPYSLCAGHLNGIYAYNLPIHIH